MTLAHNQATERWILDNWADLEPGDVGPFEARSVDYDGDWVIVACTALAMPKVRYVRLLLADVEALALETGFIQVEPEPDERPVARAAPKAKATKADEV